jgi:outer membrane protein W
VFRTVLFGVTAALLPQLAAAQQEEGGRRDWHFLTRATVSGSAKAKSPDDYTVYGGVAIEAAVARSLGEIFALEFSVRTESREVDGPETDGTPRLGSLQALPANLTVQWRPRAGSDVVFQPYAGAGVNLWAVWEKSGALDTAELPANVGPVGQIGSLFRLGPDVVISVDVKWNPLDVEIRGLTVPVPTIEVDPLTVGVGMGFVF